jgi:hypothetical protein
MLPSEGNLGFHIVSSPFIVTAYPASSDAKNEDNNCYAKSYVTILFSGTKPLALGVLAREQKFSQDHFMAMTALELSKENTNAKRRVGKHQLVKHIHSSECHNGRTIREDFARKKDERSASSFLTRSITMLLLVLLLFKRTNERSNNRWPE